MESLESEEAGLSQSTLEGLHSLIQDAPGTMSNHMTTLIPRFLALAVTPSSMVSSVVGGRNEPHYVFGSTENTSVCPCLFKRSVSATKTSGQHMCTSPLAPLHVV